MNKTNGRLKIINTIKYFLRNSIIKIPSKRILTEAFHDSFVLLVTARQKLAAICQKNKLKNIKYIFSWQVHIDLNKTQYKPSNLFSTFKLLRGCFRFGFQPA